ncbi:PQ loop repeat [Phaeobacter sp. CECT 5382]|uniref:SemiSWEET family sugar transporter n=1 Tax=Rhodobacterales TaxID=204455 RepID=UPI0006DABE0F|nr:SemiSWEET family transporter [Phaeobacter sp. CECT 5382]CUH86805.1 PQ loop repeat [Phaeobacter sp. CECT 5382]
MELYLGYSAAFMGTICWLPQAWKAWASRDTSGLSLAANLMFLLTVTLWFLYGLMVGDWPIIIANICAILIVLSIVAAILRYK